MILDLNNNPVELTTDWIVKNAKLIHYFGLGFIQVKLDDVNRLHFYTDCLETTIGMEEIHNHRYNFVSRILQGSLLQDIYECDIVGNTHILSKETCNANNKLDQEGTKCTIKRAFRYSYTKDSSYYMDHNTFHTVESNNAITHVMRSKVIKPFAEVIRPIGKELVCPFSIDVDKKTLVDIIDHMLREEYNNILNDED